jgi:hypothetical protein
MNKIDNKHLQSPSTPQGLRGISSSAVLGLVVGTLASCAGPAGDGSDPSEVVSATSRALTTSFHVTSRGLNLTPNILADWGNEKQISAALVTGHTLKVRYCGWHFPSGSVQLANLMSALGAYNGAAGVAINLVDVAAEPGTTKQHPDPATFTLPADAIYVDYSPDLDADVFASTSLPSSSCDSASPKQCTQAKLYLNEARYTAKSPSKGVFMHELGHVFGMSHINEDDDSSPRLDPSDMWFDRTTLHGHKDDGVDFRGIVIQAGTLAFLRHYYAATSDGTLDTDEIAADRNMTMVGETSGTVTPHYEWDPAKTFGWGTGASLVADFNDVKLRWNPTADAGHGVQGAFEPCSQPAGTLPHWFARMSETSTNTVDKLFEAVFEVTNNDAGTAWSQVATHSFNSYYEPGRADFRQIDWDQTFALPAAAFGLPSTGVTAKTLRKLRFRADANDSLLERDEANNDWDVNLCLYPSGSTCASDCDQSK